MKYTPVVDTELLTVGEILLFYCFYIYLIGLKDLEQKVCTKRTNKVHNTFFSDRKKVEITFHGEGKR